VRATATKASWLRCASCLKRSRGFAWQRPNAASSELEDPASRGSAVTVPDVEESEIESARLDWQSLCRITAEESHNKRGRQGKAGWLPRERPAPS
jgi:hypothetical protein